MKGIFFEGCMTLMAKNHLPIADFFTSRDLNFTAVFVSADSGVNTNEEIEILSEKKILQHNNYTSIHFTSFKSSKIEAYLISEKPDFVFIDAFRIYDQLWSAICYRLGIKVFSQQHGFEIDTLSYKPITFLSNFKRGLRYTYAVFNLSKLSNSSFLKMYYQYGKYIINGGQLKKSLLGNINFHPTIAFVYSEYYKEFWKRKYGFDKNKMVIITPSDFLLIKDIKKTVSIDACCYITMTLVEDGRMKKKDFIELMKSYRAIAQSVNKFIIKLHPRVNSTFYEEIFHGLDNVIFTRDFPNCKSYITHYSSMAFTAALISDIVVLHELPGHTTPEIFKKVASHIVKDTEGIIRIINQNIPSKLSFTEKKNQTEYYAAYTEENPYSIIYNTVIKNIKLNIIK